MKFDTAYCLSLDAKLSIYDVRDLNFDETMAFDSAKERFQCPNDACRAAFDEDNRLTTFNAKNVNYIRTPHFKNQPTTQHIEGCPYVSPKTPGLGVESGEAETDDDREEHFPSELLLTRRQYVGKPSDLPKDIEATRPTPPPYRPTVITLIPPRTRHRTRPASSPIRWNVSSRTSITRICSSACR